MYSMYGCMDETATKGVLSYGAPRVDHLFEVFLEILAVEEALSKPMWQVFLEAPGWFLLLHGGFQVVVVTSW